MKLLYQTHSPYARKALVFAHEAGLAGCIEVEHHETSPTKRNARFAPVLHPTLETGVQAITTAALDALGAHRTP